LEYFRLIFQQLNLMQDEEDQENQGDAQHPEDQENGENLEGQQLDQE